MTPEQDQAWRDMVAVGQEIGDKHWPTLEEIEAEDKAAGRIDEAKVAEHRARMRESLDRMVRDGQAAGLYEATEGEPPRTR